MCVRLPFIVAATVLACVAAQISSPHAQQGEALPAKNQRQPSCAPPVTQHIYAPLPNVGWAEAELVLNNNGVQPITVYSKFFREGSTYDGAPVTVGPSEARWLRLSELAGTPGKGLRGYEGVELSYNGRLLELGAQLTLLRPRGGTVDLPFSMAGEYASSEQHAVWPSSPGARSTVLVGNASDQTVSLVVEGPGGRDELQLGARSTAFLQNGPAAPNPKGGSGPEPNWMRLTAVGPIGAVRAAGFVEVRGQTTAGIRFYDPAAARQSNLYASNLPLANSMPVMVLKNTSRTTITVTPRFYGTDGEEAIGANVSASVSLAPDDAKVIDLLQLIQLAANRPDLVRVSVAVMSTGAPGALIGGLTAARYDGQMLSDIPLRDSGPIRHSTGTYPWRLDGDHDTTVSITNVTGGPARFHVHVGFAGGAYGRTLELPAHATAVFDLREMRANAVPDREGRTIPQGVTSGQFHWSVLSSGGETKLAGRADITSRSAGRSTSYSCPDCCPDSFSSAFLDPWDVDIAIFGTGDVQVLARYLNCYQQYYTVGANSYYAWWDVQFPSVTSMQNVWYGLSQASGNDGGTSSVWGYWDEELWNYAADYCWMEVAPAEASGVVQVKKPSALQTVYDQYNTQQFNNYDRERHYQVLDQNGQPMTQSGLPVTESYSPWSSNGCNLGAIQTGSTNTNNQGRFKDNFILSGVPTCNTNPQCTSTAQQTVRVSGNVVGTFSVTYGCNSVTVTP